MSQGDLAPTPRLRFVERTIDVDIVDPGQDMGARTVRILQQWFAENVPAYMRDDAAGEWRDVEVVCAQVLNR